MSWACTDHGLFADGVETVDVDAELDLCRSIYKHMHMTVTVAGSYMCHKPQSRGTGVCRLRLLQMRHGPLDNRPATPASAFRRITCDATQWSTLLAEIDTARWRAQQ